MLAITAFFIRNNTDLDVLAESFWTLAFYLELTENQSERPAAVASFGVLEHLAGYLDHPNLNIQRPVLRAFGHLAAGEAAVIERFCTSEFADKLICCLFSEQRFIRFDACWAVSNLVRTDKHILDLFGCPAAYNQLLEIAQFDVCPKNSAEALACLSGFAQNGDPHQLEDLLVRHAIVAALMVCLEKDVVAVIKAALDCLEPLLEHAEGFRSLTQDNCVVDLVLNSTRFSRLEHLATIGNAAIAYKARELLEKYFPEAE